MPRPQSPEGRRHTVCTKLSDAEFEAVEAARGNMERSEWLREAALLVAAKSQQSSSVPQGGPGALGVPPLLPCPAISFGGRVTAADGAEHLQNFISTEGEHWLAQVARTGLGNNSVRSELIARTEVARAINSAAIQCYRDYGVTHKHLGLSPGACEACEDAAEDGDIPLDAPFSAGGVLGTVHPGCRCVPLPSGVEVEPPLADLGKASGASLNLPPAPADDDSRLVWLLLRARGEDGKWRFLLQQRPDGTWGMPGGKPHVGEDPWDAAVRETIEEIGNIPTPRPVATFHHVEDDGRTQVFLWLCDVPYFRLSLDGGTPEETRGAAWFRRKEIAALDLAPRFREDWERGVSLREHVTKALQRVVDENGEVLVLDKPAQRLQATGARWPYPHRADGAEDANGSPHWPDAGPGSYPGASPGDEPPGHFISDGAEAEPHGDVAPRGGQDGKMPRGRKPNPPASRFPDQGEQDMDAWPYPQNTLAPPMTSVGAPKRAKVSKESVNYRAGTDAEHCGNCVMFHPRDGSCDLVKGEVHPRGVCDRWEAAPAEKNDSGHPVVGSVPPKTPEPYRPHSVEPEVFDPASAVEDWSPEAGSDVAHSLPGSTRGKPGTRKGAADPSDPNPVEAFHVYSQLLQNFPPKAIEWVKDPGIHWVGPVAIQHDRVDYDDEEKWAAHHQQQRVRHFARLYRRGEDVSPGVSVQKPGKNTINVEDGHHRCLGSRQAGKPFLTYVGFVPQAGGPWDEMHSSQLHQGSNPANKLLE